jgi:hypothetical protein
MPDGRASVKSKWELAVRWWCLKIEGNTASAIGRCSFPGRKYFFHANEKSPQEAAGGAFFS